MFGWFKKKPTKTPEEIKADNCLDVYSSFPPPPKLANYLYYRTARPEVVEGTQEIYWPVEYSGNHGGLCVDWCATREKAMRRARDLTSDTRKKAFASYDRQWNEYELKWSAYEKRCSDAGCVTATKKTKVAYV